jgi:hypothetical protein
MNDNPFASDNKKRASNKQGPKQKPAEIDERSSFSVIKDELGLSKKSETSTFATIKDELGMSKKEKTSRLSTLKDELGLRDKEDQAGTFATIKDELGMSKKEKTSRLSALKDELGIKQKRSPKTTVSFDDFDEKADEQDIFNEGPSPKETSKKSGRYFKWIVAIGSVIVLIIAILAS